MAGTSSTLHEKSTVATRTVQTRRIAFDHSQVGRRRHYVDGDLIESHLLSVLSAVIPKGELFVADTVRRYRKRIDDPALKAQANSFVGQEMIHQREHDRFNDALAKLGYPTAPIDRASAVTFAMFSRFPPRLQVAMTAAIEHYTAVIAEHVLEREQLEHWDMPEEVRDFLGWHLVEELEHKAVAFDTMQAVGTTEAERILAMRLVTALMLPLVVGGLALSLASDRSAWDPRRLLGSVANLRTTIFTRRSFRRDLFRYYRDGFHPDERDIAGQLDRWRAELLGPEGKLADRLSHAPGAT